MKSLKLAVVAISLIGIFGVGNAMALDTATINVSATVLGTCAFDTGAYNMAFGEIATTDTGDKTASVMLAFTCSNGTTWTLDDEGFTNAGAKSMTGADTGDTLAYQIDDYSLSAMGNGTTQNVTVTGRIFDTDYSVAAADVYTHSFTIDINP
jgi:hypothetical protein